MPCCPPSCCSTGCPPLLIRTAPPPQSAQCCTFNLPAMKVCAEVPPAPRIRPPPKLCNIPVMICEDPECCCVSSCGPTCPPRRGGGGGRSGGCCPPPCPCPCPCPGQISCCPRPTIVPPRICPPSCCSPCGPCCPPSCCPTDCCQTTCDVYTPQGGSSGGGGGNSTGGCKNRREKRWPQCNFLRPCIDTRIYRDGEHMCISYAGHIPGEQFIHGRNLPTTTTFAKRRLCTFTPYEYVDPDGCCTFP